jgi:hypothetical protein
MMAKQILSTSYSTYLPLDVWSKHCVGCLTLYEKVFLSMTSCFQQNVLKDHFTHYGIIFHQSNASADEEWVHQIRTALHGMAKLLTLTQYQSVSFCQVIFSKGDHSFYEIDILVDFLKVPFRMSSPSSTSSNERVHLQGTVRVLLSGKCEMNDLNIYGLVATANANVSCENCIFYPSRNSTITSFINVTGKSHVLLNHCIFQKLIGKEKVSSYCIFGSGKGVFVELYGCLFLFENGDMKLAIVHSRYLALIQIGDGCVFQRKVSSDVEEAFGGRVVDVR